MALPGLAGPGPDLLVSEALRGLGHLGPEPLGPHPQPPAVEDDQEDGHDDHDPGDGGHQGQQQGGVLCKKLYS